MVDLAAGGDRRRQRKLEAAGWHFRRVTYADSVNAKDAVIADVKRILQRARREWS